MRSRCSSQYATWSRVLGRTEPGRIVTRLRVAKGGVSYFRRSTARWSCCLFIFERPEMFIRLASLYSCSFVRPFGRFVPERRPPRRPDEMSCRDVLDDVRASPERARSLLTVRAAISFALLVEAPCSLALSLMCSYCRSRLLLHASWGIQTSFFGGLPRPRRL